MGPSRFDEAKARAAGFALVADPGKVAFTFDVPERRTTEHLLEIQALLIKPGEEESPTRHQRLYQFLSVPDGTTPSGALRDQVKIQSALYSEPSKDPKVVLLPRTELQGLEILVAYHPSGVEDQEVGLPTQDRALDWLRLPLAERKVEVGKGWVANLPVDVGDRREVTSALYGLRRVVRFQGHDVAVLEGRFRSRMQERDDLRRGSLGQDRVLFDLDDGVVLYREFRTEAEMAARGSDAIHRVRARIKGIVFERALFAGTKDRAGRLAAASDLF